MLAVAADPWRWQPHVDVWLLVATLVAAGVYSIRVLGPKVVTTGSVVTDRQLACFVGAVVAFWVASDWPIHDISEEYLYSAHMVQHLLLSLVFAPLLLAATPEWLARLVLAPHGEPPRWLRRVLSPLVAGLAYNAVVALTHAPSVVNTAASSPPFHYLVHTMVVLTALLMWMPVIGPLPQVRMHGPGQMVYLFLMSVIPTLPAAWLTFADGTVYRTYDHDVRVFGLSVAEDQQTAGIIMKVIAGSYLWVWMGARFFQWAGTHYRTLEGEREVVTYHRALTTSDVEREFARTPAAPE